jgi:hypothetical protein
VSWFAGEQPSVVERAARPLVAVHPLATVLQTGYYLNIIVLPRGPSYFVGPYDTYQEALAAQHTYQFPNYSASAPLLLQAGQNFPGT